MATNQSRFAPFKTKLSPPNVISDQLVVRKRLQVKDYHNWLHKLVSVNAPAGYGKSMLLWQWYQQAPSTMGRGWLSIDAQDNDSTRLMHHLICACQQGYSQELSIAKSILNNVGNLSAEHLLDELLVEIEQLEQPLLLFIDDIHLITQRKSLDLIKQFIHRVPPYLGIIVAGRTRLRIALSKLKVSRRLIEYNVSAIHFNQVEINQFFAKANFNQLTEQQLNMVQGKTEGWVAGMQLVALACESQPIDEVLAKLSGSFDDIADYLGELVFQQQPKALQKFLLKSSVLERFNVSLCRAVLEQDEVNQYLEEVKSKQLFLITLDSHGEWYRYHRLFQDYLQQQIRQNYYESYQYCLEKASAWCEQEQLVNEAVNYALKGKLYARVADLLSEYGLEMRLSQFNYQDFRSWFQQIPKKYFKKWPLMTLCAAYHELDMVNYKQAKQYIEIVDCWLLKHNLADNNNSELLQKIVATRDTTHLLILCSYRDDEELFAEYQRWKEKYPNLQEHYALIVYSDLAGRYHTSYKHKLAEKMAQLTADGTLKLKIYIGFTWANIKRTLVNLKQGKLLVAEDIIANTIDKLEQENASYFKRFLYPIMSHIKWEQGNIDQAEHYVQLSSIKSIEKLNSCTLTTSSYLVAAKLAWLKENYRQAQDLLIEAQEKVKLPRFFFEVIAERYRQLTFKQDINGMCELKSLAQTRREMLELVSDSIKENIDEVFQVIEIRVSIAQNKLSEALKLLIVLLQKFEQQERYTEVVKLLIMEAHVFHKMDNDRDALIALKEAFVLAVPNKMIMPVIEEGYAIKVLIKQSLEQLSYPENELLLSDYQQKLFTLLGDGLDQEDQTVHKELFYETLTKRESIILQHLDSLLTLDQVATKLKVSINTLKWHLTNLYQKLQARNRHTAVIQAKQFGLLDNN